MTPRRGRLSAPSLVVLALLVLFGATGCGHLPTAGPVEEVVIDPAAPAGTSGDLNLGPGVRPLSLGPGDKSSPRVSPSGDRLAFVLDGYAVEKSLYAQDPRRRTTEGSSATGAEWLSGEELAVSGPQAGVRDEDAGALSVTRPGETPETVELADGVRAVAAQANGGSVAAVVETPGGGVTEATILRIRAGGDAVRIFPLDVRGRVSGLSLSPDGREALLAVRISFGEDAGRVELVRYRFLEGNPRRAALLEEGLEVIGAPQSTARGIYFIAGEEGDEEAAYSLYQVPAGAEEYEPARGVGEDFVPASVAVSPDGEDLAVLGRRSSRSPTDLYVLGLATDALDAVTANENMEIKTKPRDLAWSPDGSYVLVVARGILPGYEVYGSPAEDLSSAFYNVYGVPAGTAAGGSVGLRSALFWLAGASLAFFATAGAFLVLANFGTAPKASDPIPRNGPSGAGPSGPELALKFSEERLEGLERGPNQALTLYLENRGEKELRGVDLELKISSEDTARPGARRYRETVAGLAPGEVEAVDLTVNLSPPRPVEGMALIEDGSGGDREILEARAYPPGGAVVVETAILSP